LNPPLHVASGAEVVKALVPAGFVEVSQRGSHRKLRNGETTVIVPMPKELASGTFRSIIRQSGISVEEFLEFL
jgi:predicted RNA binding protein YcfA (HicA-like mRNA interferase family)